ncbi:MAG: hypothetical protein KKE53_04880 [Proteobacteria bacterium]|nr:hypothetical protein [Pseudomonadota bacterium]
MIQKGISISPESIKRVPAKDRRAEEVKPILIPAKAVDHNNHAKMASAMVLREGLFCKTGLLYFVVILPLYSIKTRCILPLNILVVPLIKQCCSGPEMLFFQTLAGDLSGM